ncbi:M1 family metallopeptidase [Companilactobacillus ginsenosidimutans]|uniref:Aminopeptidase n=1 Tax=Companilactobacillus ginsenosidimutans TaxID=1007676 RepID=A0A0H4QGB0_9LACO|nr:M1 family metallopeptidase [Companilactobacillus ginsenosidimutans]AKP67439.1 peptidase [Companilactobacillus ginsenosidimutans]
MTGITHSFDTFQPTHYDIFIDINRGTKQISGKSVIDGEAKDKQIFIQQKNMEIASVQADGNDVPFNVDNKKEVINITLPKAGETTLAVEYKAPLTDSMMGIYPSYYEVDGEKKELIGTQFETTFARQAFPSVDEPEAKAKFDLAIKFDEKPGETILANMPEVRTENGIHYFDTTVRMSTYLIAFAFGDLQSKQTTTKSGVKVGVFSTKAHEPKELDFALDIAKRSIEFYEDFYQTPYPLPHSWQLALPDFSAGAMENWGLVTYREAYLLLDPDNTALDTKQLVATVISHELAHQWFGDLVTMKWWDDLWLNESFANMMEYVAIDAIEPDWNVWELFQTTDVPAALQRDATDGVQSVHVNVEDPAEIDALFDSAIVYAKGARMLVMMRALVGDDALREGLKNYFAAHKFANAKGSDLWDAIGEAAGMDVASIMNTWLEQPGYPIVRARVVDGNLKLTQQQFFIGDGKEAGRSWKIPLNSNYDVAPKIFGNKEVDLGNYEELRKANGVPFRVNVGNNSHFIVRYDKTLLMDIMDNLDTVDSISQMAILQDLRLLAESRQMSYAAVVPLLKHFADNKSTVVNSAMYRFAYNLRKFITPNTDEEKNLKKLYNNLSAKQLTRLGWSQKADETIDDQLTRPAILNAALYAENPEALKSAHELFEANKDSLATLPADIRIFVLRNEMKNYGSEDLFNDLLDQYRKTTDPSYKSDLCVAITSTKDAKLIAKLIEKFEDADTIKPQDLRAWFSGVLNNADGEQAAWDWLRNDWKWLEDTVGGDMEFTTYITVAMSVFRTPERLQEFKAFFEPKINTPGLTREIKMDISIIESRVGLIQDEKDDVNAAIKLVAGE